MPTYVVQNSFNATMDPADHDPTSLSTCTSCTFTEDFSNYWTATLFFRARNGTLHRVPQKGNEYLEQANGGITVYYIQPSDNSNVTAFAPVRCFPEGLVHELSVTMDRASEWS